MTLLQFVQINHLQQIDAIILRKKILGMVDHYAIFYGYRDNTPVFIANYRDGVKEIQEGEMAEFLSKLEPKQIDRFPGPESERPKAVQRARSRIGEKAYNYLANNCEHFKNWVHYGENYSSQVDNTGNALLVAGAGLTVGGLAAENDEAALWGLGIILLGALIKGSAK